MNIKKIKVPNYNKIKQEELEARKSVDYNKKCLQGNIKDRKPLFAENFIASIEAQRSITEDCLQGLESIKKTKADALLRALERD